MSSTGTLDCNGKQGLVCHGAASDRQQSGDLPGRGRQGVPPRQQRLTQRGGKLPGKALHIGGQVTHQQLGEVGVAARPGQHVADELLTGRAAQQGGDLLGALVRVEAGEDQLKTQGRRRTSASQPCSGCPAGRSSSRMVTTRARFCARNPVIR